jgi:hypothetical protein
MRTGIIVQIFRAALVALVFGGLPMGIADAESATPDDTARFLAGLRPAPGSPLSALTQDRTWQAHAERFNAAFARVEEHQLKHIRAWAHAKLTPSPVLFYFFSGPDFLYANAFFPDATTYVMAGLEPPGPIPDLSDMPRGAVGSSLHALAGSLDSLMSNSFFITKEMRHQFTATRLSGTLPVLYAFLARSGKTIRDVSLIRLTQDGTVEADNAPGISAQVAHGAKIVFADENGREHTLYYFGTNIANDGFRQSGLARFCERLGSGDAFVKSASYLLHGGGFSDVRNFLLTHARTLLQDDTGVPLANFDQSRWQLHPYGRYAGPISIFANRYQPGMARLFSHAQPIDFGIGYKWRTPNLLAAVNTTAPADVATTEPAAVGVSAPQAQGPTSENVPKIIADEPASELRVAAGRQAERSHKTQVTHRVRTARVQQAAPRSFWWPVWRPGVQ